MQSIRNPLFAGAMLLLLSAPVQAYDLNDRLSIGGVLAGAEQCQDLSEDTVAPDACRAALSFQPHVHFRPNEGNELFVKFGFADGNGLNTISPFVLVPWAADLEDDVININGRNRDYLLTAWYKHTFGAGKERSLSLTGGIIDSTDYLDNNNYADDQYNQFMNDVFDGAITAFLPSYDYGSAIELERGDWSLKAVVMNIGENVDGNNYTFFGGQIARTIKSSLGSGTYRVLITGTDKQFVDPTGTDRDNLVGLVFNADQELGDRLGTFIRVGWQKDDAEIDYDVLLSGGLDIGGITWERPDDNIGLGFAYLNGGNGDVSATYVFEAYYRLSVHQNYALSGDVQYIKDVQKSGSETKGFIIGLRGTAEF